MKKVKLIVIIVLIAVALFVCLYFLLNPGPPETSVGELNIPRIEHTATLLNDGRVLIVGGRSKLSSNTAEIYDPETNVSRLLRSRTNVPHKNHSAFLLKNGRVLIIDKTGIEEFDPISNQFKFMSHLLKPREDIFSILLSNENVLIIEDKHNQGYTDKGRFRAPFVIELYNYKTNKIYKIESLLDTSYITKIKAVQMSENKVLIIENNMYYWFNIKDNKVENVKNKIISSLDNDGYYPIIGVVRSYKDDIFVIFEDTIFGIYFYRHNTANNSNKLLMRLDNNKYLSPDIYLLNNGKLLILSSISMKLSIYDPLANEIIMTRKGYNGGSPVELKEGKVLITGGEMMCGSIFCTIMRLWNEEGTTSIDIFNVE